MATGHRAVPSSFHPSLANAAAITVMAVAGVVPGPALAMEEIVVTARKREERLQEVPMSVAALSEERLREFGLRSDEDVAAFTPNFNTVRRVGRSEDRPVIRGMSNPPDKGEANASYFIDGVFVSGSISTATTAAVERVEVLRGPQSAQFGRATFSGAVNYVTRAPTEDLAGGVTARYGSSEERQIAGWFSGPLLEERLSFLVSASHEEYGGQWRNNLKPGSAFVPGNFLSGVFNGQSMEGDTSELGGQETSEVLTKLRWTPFEGSTATLKYSYSKGDDFLYPTNVRPNGDGYFPNLNCYIPDDPSQPWFGTSRGEFCGEITADGTENRKNIPDLRNGIVSESPLALHLPEEWRTADPAEPGLRRETHRVLGEWAQDLADWTLTFRGSWSKDDFDNVIDLDQQEVRAVWNLFLFHLRDEIDDRSFELSLASPAEKPVRGKIGAYYFQRDEVSFERSFTGPAAVFGVEPGAGFNVPRIKDTENVSVFGSLALDLAPRVTLDLEARYARDDKDIQGGQRSAVDNTPRPTHTSLSFRNFTPRITLSWRVTDDLMVYTLAAKGNKPGDFNEDYYRGSIPSEFTEFQMSCTPGELFQRPGYAIFTCTEQLKSDLIVDEEEQWTYEAGVKSSWLGGALTLNLSGFYIDWRDQALSELAPTPGANGTISSIQTLRNTGQSKITGLELETSWAPLETLSVFFNYGLANGKFVEGHSPNYAEATGGTGDITGHQLPDTPKHSAVLGFEARTPVADTLTAFVRADASWESRRYMRASNLSWTGANTIANLRLGVEGETWSVNAYVRNLLDDQTPLADFGFINYAADPIYTAPGLPNDSTSTAIYPLLYGVIPRPGRDAGLEFRYRFGS